MFAGSLRLVLLQPCEPRTEQHLLAFLDTFGERIGFPEKVFDLCLRELQSLPRIFLVWECADLNNPPRTRLSGGLRCLC
jgi:hypothetical protein